jgi:two-component system sensor histidine kinase CiaH
MNEQKFSNARTSLTLWYELFLFIIVVAFSLVLFATETSNFGRVVIQRNFGNHPPRLLSENELHDLQDQVAELRRSFAVDLIVVDTAILLIGGGLGYILAGKTLEPIKRTFEEQKNFLANASHEFRTPLAAIQTASEVALRSKSKTKEDYRKVLSQTLQESIRLSIIADELLMLSRIDAGIVQLQFTTCDLSEIANEVLGEVQPLISAKKLQVLREIVPHLKVQGDGHRLKQLILILIDNAIKFTKEQGTVTIRLEKKPKVQLHIIDNGIGIAKKDVPHIFERFYQADTVRGGNSAGLGLSIAQWIVTAHHAAISVQSVSGKGSDFSVTFG